MNQTIVPEFVLAKYQQGLFVGEFKAATLFVDISGFTKLTETFLIHHREGAEALTEALRQIFSPQIQILYERGGFIPFFAGDAFIAIFPYDDEDFGEESAHLQAVKTAVDIQNYVCQDNNHRLIETKHGTFGFGVTIGLAFGTVQWGLPGNSDQKSFYFRGEAITGCSDAQTKAQTGQIVLHQSIKTRLDESFNIVPTQEEAYYYLIDRDLHVEQVEPVPETELIQDISPFVPSQVVHLQVNEFREVCTIFISFDPPNDVQKFHNFVLEVTNLLNQYGGYLNQIDVGDKGSLFVILFGAPVAYENNLHRASGFLQKMLELNFPVRWRAGMTYGLLWAGIRGGDKRTEYGVVGNEINLAARLALKADWGQILVSEVVYRELKNAYLFYSLGNFELKGKSEEIPIYLFVYRYDSIDYHDYGGQFIGRDSEVTQLELVSTAVFTQKKAQAVFVYGDIGVGKTRLIFEMRKKILYRYFPQTFYCQADELQKISLNPFKRFLRNYFDLKPDFTVEDNKNAFNQQFAYLLSQLKDGVENSGAIVRELERTKSILGAMVGLYWQNSLYENLEPALRFDNTIRAFTNLLKAASLIRPVILHIEDARWLDDDSENLFKSLTYELIDFPVLFVLTCRYLDSGEIIEFSHNPNMQTTTVRLEHLNLDEVRTLAEDLLKTAVSEEVAHFLAEKTNGNPFFIEQLLADLRERGALAFSEASNVTQIIQKTIKIDDIPTTINTLLLSRLDRLDQKIKNIIRSASVLGNQFELSVLEEVTGAPSDFKELIDIAEQHQIWFAVNKRTYQFSNALLRDASYAMQLKSNIRELHRLASQAINKIYANDIQSHYAELAFHSHKGEQFAIASRWYELASEEAQSDFANNDALNYVTLGLELNLEQNVEREFNLRFRRENILGIQGQRKLQKQEIDHLLSMAIDQNNLKKQTAVYHLFAKYAEATGNYQALIEYANETARLARDSMATKELVAAHLLQGKAYYRLGEYGQAHHWLKEGLAQAQINNLKSLEASSLRQIGIVMVDEGHLEKAEQYYAEALKIYTEIDEKMGVGTTYNNLGVVNWNSGDFSEAQEYYSFALAIYEQIGYRRGENMTLMNLGIIANDISDFERAHNYFEQVNQNLKIINERFGICIANLNRMDVFLNQENYDSAHELGGQVYLLAEEIGAKRLVGLALSKIGVVLQQKGKLVGAEKAFNDAIDIWVQMKQKDPEFEVRAHLALLYSDKNMLHAAKEEIESVIQYLNENRARIPKIGYIKETLFNCYLVLTRLDDNRAVDYIKQAHQLLLEASEKIREEKFHDRFMNHMPINRKIVDRYIFHFA
ncbi:MAG: tetratricopeptide repeat protein [Chloroflexota bacterium]